jgi:hypothetical protein
VARERAAALSTQVRACCAWCVCVCCVCCVCVVCVWFVCCVCCVCVCVVCVVGVMRLLCVYVVRVVCVLRLICVRGVWCVVCLSAALSAQVREQQEREVEVAKEKDRLRKGWFVIGGGAGATVGEEGGMEQGQEWRRRTTSGVQGTREVERATWKCAPQGPCSSDQPISRFS